MPGKFALNRNCWENFEKFQFSGVGEVKGVNWDNVKAVSGATFEIRPYLKQMGFKWDGAKKSWVK